MDKIIRDRVAVIDKIIHRDPNEALADIDKAIENAMIPKNETLFQKKNRLLKKLEDARKSELVLIRQKAIQEGENGKEGYNAGLEKRVESDTKHVSRVIAKKESLELQSRQLDEAKGILEKLEADGDKTSFKLKERIPEKFKKPETDLILEILVNKYAGELEQIGEQYYENLKVEELQYEGEHLGAKTEDKSEDARINQTNRASTYLDNLVKEKEQIIKMLENRKRTYEATDLQLTTQNIEFSEKMDQVKTEINGLVKLYKQKKQEFVALKGENIDSDIKPGRASAVNGETSTETPQISQNLSKLSSSTSKMHEILKTAHTEILSSRNARNLLIRECYTSVKHISSLEPFIASENEKTKQFSAKPWKDAFAKVDWEKTTENIEKVNKVFVDLKEKNEEHQEKFMEVKSEVKRVLKVEKKERLVESEGTGKKKKVKIENASNHRAEAQPYASNDNEVIEID